MPMLYAAVTGIPEKIPLSLTSGGMNKLAAILLAPANQPGGVLLIDELEAGFYHKRLPLIWNSIHALAKEYDSPSALRPQRDSQKNFLMTFRLYDRSCKMVRPSTRFANAIEEQIDVR
jgi:hypothetical protein